MADGTFPGMVTSNVVGSTYRAPTPEQERRSQMMLQREWELQDRRFRQQEEARMYALGRQRQAQEEAEQEAKMREAYNMLVAPSVQSRWNISKGYLQGVKRGVGAGEGTVAVHPPGTGGGFYKWVRPEPMPKGYLEQNLANMWKMWRATQQMPGEARKPFYPIQEAGAGRPSHGHSLSF